MATLQLGSDALAVSPVSGQVEYNGIIQTFTPLGTQRGIVPAEQFFRLNANVVGANATGAQSIFGVGVTLSASTQYEFEAHIVLSKTAGTTTHSISLGFGGTATINNALVEYLQTVGASALPVILNQVNGAVTASVSAIVATGSAIVTAARTEAFIIRGTVSINAGGTFIPQYTLSAAPGGAYSTVAGSYIKIKPIGVSGANVSVGTWA